MRANSQRRSVSSPAEYETLLRDHAAETLPRYNLALAWLQLGEARKAKKQLKAILHLSPGDRKAAIKLAWVLSTWPDAAERDGPEALKILSGAGAVDNDTDPMYLDSLAAAYAETGNYRRAAILAERAADLSDETGSLNMARPIRERVLLYQSGRPYRVR